MSNQKEAFLGKGWQFPIEADPHAKKIKTVAYEDDIKEAIYIILMTRKGERVMRPDFGCAVFDHQFDVISYTVLKQMEQKVKNALVFWEPRIKDIEVVAEISDLEPQRVNINIEYVVRRTNSPYNLVYPFYTYEGMA